MDYRGKLYFCEQVRRPIRRGDFLIMTDQKLPITEFGDTSHWNDAAFNRASRYQDSVERLLEYTDACNAEHERRQAELGEQLEDELKEAHRVWSTKADDGSWRPGEG